MPEPFRITQTPNGGWDFIQPQTRWRMPNPVSQTHDSAVKEIIKHRQGNTAISVRHGLRTDFASVSAELVAFTKARLGIVDPTPPPKSPPQQHSLPQVVAGAVEAIKRTAQGVAPIMEWLGSNGAAVPPEQSSKRAEICAGCPKNGSPQLSDWFTVKASEAIKRELERRADLKLETPYDDRLGVCAACLCPMRLKVHTPIDIINKHTKPEVRAELHPQCWILSNG